MRTKPPFALRVKCCMYPVPSLNPMSGIVSSGGITYQSFELYCENCDTTWARATVVYNSVSSDVEIVGLE